MNFLTVVFEIKMASAAGQDDPAGEHNNKQVSIHVREDSASELDALFDIALNKGSQRPLQVPLRMRNLPASFWQPPTIGSKSPSVHSRENSLDNSLGAGPFSPGPIASPGPPGIGPSHHSRANSCPATLGQTLAVAQQHQVTRYYFIITAAHVCSRTWVQLSFFALSTYSVCTHFHPQRTTTGLTITLIIPHSHQNIKQQVGYKNGREPNLQKQKKRPVQSNTQWF